MSQPVTGTGIWRCRRLSGVSRSDPLGNSGSGDASCANDIGACGRTCGRELADGADARQHHRVAAGQRAACSRASPQDRAACVPESQRTDVHTETRYTKPACVACKATFRALNNAGIAYLQAPVVYAGPDNHFSGSGPIA